MNKNILILISFLLSVIVAQRSWGTDPPVTATPGSKRDTVRAVQLARIAGVMGKELSVTMVSFESATAIGYRAKDGKPTAETVKVAMTVCLDKEGGRVVFKIIGNISLKKSLLGNAPQLGKVDEEIAVQPKWGGDAAYKRLRDLLPDPPTNVEARTFLMVAKDKADGLLSSTFIGPIPDGEEEQVAAIVNELAKKPLALWTAEDIRNAQESANPWFQAAAKLRLSAAGATGPS